MILSLILFLTLNAHATGTTCDRYSRPTPAVVADKLIHATTFLEKRAAQWVHEQGCISCHTVLPYVMGQFDATALNRDAFTQIDNLVRHRVQKFDSTPPWYDGSHASQSKATESVMNSLILAKIDQLKGATRASPETLLSFSKMRELQNADGSWSWLDWSLQPWESYQAAPFGASLAAMAIARSEAGHLPQFAGMIAKIRSYLKTTDQAAATHLWDRLCILLAEAELGSVIETSRVSAILKDLFDKQLDSGGWSMNDFGSWQKHGDQSCAKAQNADGYATAYGMFVLKSLKASGKIPTGLKTQLDSAYQGGLYWLITNQSSSGKWPSASLNSTNTFNQNLVEDAATGFGMAVLTN